MKLNPNTTLEIISKSEIRYQGQFKSLNNEPHSITLLNVRSFGTEDRNPVHVVEKSSNIYETMTFKLINLKCFRLGIGAWSDIDKMYDLANQRNVVYNENNGLTNNIKKMSFSEQSYDANTESTNDLSDFRNYKLTPDNEVNEFRKSLEKSDYSERGENESHAYKNNKKSYNAYLIEQRATKQLDVIVPEEEYDLNTTEQNTRIVDKDELKRKSKDYYDKEKGFYDKFTH